MRALDCPTLLVIGENSEGAIISPEQAVEANAINGLVQSHQVFQAGHAIRYDQFALFMAAVEPFLDSLLLST